MLQGLFFSVSCLNCMSIQNFTRGQNCRSSQNCMKILSHKGLLLRKDTFAWADNFAQRHFCTGWTYYLFSLFILIFILIFFSITVTPNPYPRSVTYYFFINLSFFPLFFVFFFTLVQKWTSVQSCKSCKIDPWCKIFFVQFCPLVQFYVHAC